MTRINIAKARNIVIAVFAVVFIFSVGYALGLKGFAASISGFPKVTINRETPVEKELDFNLFWKVWDTLTAEYVDKSKVIPSEMVYGAIKGMVSSLGDPYTVFLTPSENKVAEDDLSGNFDGVGIQIGYRNSQLAVIAPLPGTPADKAGVLAGDYIINIKDEKKEIDLTTNEMSIQRAVQIIRGEKGTTVTLTMIREGENEPLVFDLVRQNIDVASVVLEFVGEGKDIAHLKVLKFGAETKSEWDKEVRTIIATSGVKKVIVDLRNNPGGYLQSAIDLASDFMPAGSVVVSEEDAHGQKHELKTTISPRLSNYQVVVLVNGGSASASEILSGALRDNRNIKLVGDNTFGKGTVQEPMDLDNGAGLHITIAKWLTPSGTWIHLKGIAPDTEVKNDPDTIEDEQLLEAIKLISGNSQ